MQSTGVKKLKVIHVPADLVVTPKEAVVSVGDIVEAIQTPDSNNSKPAFIQVAHKNYTAFLRPEEVQDINEADSYTGSAYESAYNDYYF